MLRAAGLRVEAHDDHFPDQEKPPDHVWLRMTADPEPARPGRIEIWYEPE
jgi:hypothetical protein